MNNDTKIIKAICCIVGLVSFFLITGLVGGYENNTITTGAFIKSEVISIMSLFVSARGIDLMEQIEDGRK